MNKKSILTNSFMKDFIKLTKREQKQVIKAIKLMESNIKHSSLNCHKVDNTPYHEVYSNMDVRIIFELSSDFYVLYRVGHHDILDKL